jgi:hypothetical protein
MRPFISRSCSREDDRLTGSAPGSCSQRVDETVYLSVLFSRRRPFDGPRFTACLVPSATTRPSSLYCLVLEKTIDWHASVGFELGNLESARRECSRILPELFPWELPLPWAPFKVRNPTAICPERGDLARGSACAKDADTSTSRGAGTSAIARTRNACVRSAAGRRLAARLSVAETSASKPSMPRPRRSAASEPKSRPRPLRTRTLRPRVVTQQKIFSSPILRSARLLRTPRDLAPQPGSLLLRHLLPGRSQRPGPGT